MDKAPEGSIVVDPELLDDILDGTRKRYLAGYREFKLSMSPHHWVYTETPTAVPNILAGLSSISEEFSHATNGA